MKNYNLIKILIDLGSKGVRGAKIVIGRLNNKLNLGIKKKEYKKVKHEDVCQILGSISRQNMFFIARNLDKYEVVEDMKASAQNIAHKNPKYVGVKGHMKSIVKKLQRELKGLDEPTVKDIEDLLDIEVKYLNMVKNSNERPDNGAYRTRDRDHHNCNGLKNPKVYNPIRA